MISHNFLFDERLVGSFLQVGRKEIGQALEVSSKPQVFCVGVAQGLFEIGDSVSIVVVHSIVVIVFSQEGIFCGSLELLFSVFRFLILDFKFIQFLLEFLNELVFAFVLLRLAFEVFLEIAVVQ